MPYCSGAKSIYFLQGLSLSVVLGVNVWHVFQFSALELPPKHHIRRDRMETSRTPPLVYVMPSTNPLFFLQPSYPYLKFCALKEYCIAFDCCFSCPR